MIQTLMVAVLIKILIYDTDPNYFSCVVIKLSKVRAKDKEVWPACLVRSWEELCTCATLKMVDTNRPTTNKSRGWVVFFKILTLGIERQVIKKTYVYKQWWAKLQLFRY
jgi:hypothetical protein